MTTENQRPELPSEDPQVLKLIGRPDSLWVRPLWLNPAFWETYPSEARPAPPGSSHSNQQNDAHPPMALFSRLTKGSVWSFSLHDSRGKALLEARGCTLPGTRRHRLLEGYLHWEGHLIRLPPGLDLSLKAGGPDQIALTLSHTALGPFCTFERISLSEGEGARRVTSGGRFGYCFGV